MRNLIWVLLLPMVLVLAGCGDDVRTAAPTQTPQLSVSTPSPAPSATPSSTRQVSEQLEEPTVMAADTPTQLAIAATATPTYRTLPPTVEATVTSSPTPYPDNSPELPTAMSTATATNTATIMTLATATVSAIPTEPDVPTIPVGTITYIVQSGDTLSSIAARFGTTVEDVKRDNGLDGDTIFVGQTLLIVGQGDARPTAQLGEATEVAGEVPQGASVPLPPRGEQIDHVASGQGEVALMLNADSVEGHIATILETLRSHDTRLSFFLTGNYLESFPEQVRAIDVAGHEIASHGYRHVDFRGLTSGEIVSELDQWREAFKAITGKTGPNYWQPPYGYSDTHVRQAAFDHGYTTVYWTLDVLDAVGNPKSKEFVLDRVFETAWVNLDGAIILMHVDKDGTIEALPEILEGLEQRNLRAVTISELLSR